MRTENYGLFLRYEAGTEGLVDLVSLAGLGIVVER